MVHGVTGPGQARPSALPNPVRRSAAGVLFRPPARGSAALAALLALAAGLVGCDMEVTNPGPVHDEFLNDKAAQPALVNGMGRAFAQGLNWIAYTGAAVAREIHPSGSDRISRTNQIEPPRPKETARIL